MCASHAHKLLPIAFAEVKSYQVSFRLTSCFASRSAQEPHVHQLDFVFKNLLNRKLSLFSDLTDLAVM